MNLSTILLLGTLHAGAAPAPKDESPEQIAAIFKQLQLPPLPGHAPLAERKLTRDDFTRMNRALQDYPEDDLNMDTVLKEPAKFAKEHPLRAGLAEAILAIRKFEVELPRELRSPIDNRTRTMHIDRLIRLVAETQGTLEDLGEKLDGAARDREKSKRWLAHFDLVRADVRLRQAATLEYNLAIGAIRTDKLPALDPAKHDGWRLVPIEKMNSPKEIRDNATAAKKAHQAIVKNHSDTPWAVLAAEKQALKLGFAWEPAKLK